MGSFCVPGKRAEGVAIYKGGIPPLVPEPEFLHSPKPKKVKAAASLGARSVEEENYWGEEEIMAGRQEN